MCFDFLYKFVWNLSHSKKNRARYDHKSILVFLQNTCYSYHVLIKLEIYWKVSEKSSNTNFMKILSLGAELFHAARKKDGRTDG